MKRFPKILAATCAAVALSASLAFAADAIAPKTTVPAQQVACPGARGGMGYGMMQGRGMMAYGQAGQGQMGPGMMNGVNHGNMMDGSGQYHMRGAGAAANTGRTL